MKKILQKTLGRLQALLLLVVMFIGGGNSAYAQSVTFDFVNEGPCNNEQGETLTKNGVKVTFASYNAGADIYSTWDGYSILLESATNIVKVEFEGSDAAYGASVVVASLGDFNFSLSGTSVWTGSATSLRFKGANNNTDFYVTTMRVWLEGDDLGGGDQGGGDDGATTSFEIATDAFTGGTITENGVSVSGSPYNSKIDIYYAQPYADNWTVTVESAQFPIKEIEFFHNKGTRLDATPDCGQLSGNVWSDKGTKNIQRVVFDPNYGLDAEISKIRVTLYTNGEGPVVTPRENTVDLTTEGLAMSPAEGTMDYLTKYITLYLDTNCENTYSGNNGVSIPDGVTLQDASGNNVAISQFNYWADGNQVGIQLANNVYTPGVYTLTIPEGTVPCVGNKGNKAFEFVFTVSPTFPENGKKYIVKNVDSDKYINIKSDASYCTYLADDAEPLSFTLDVANGGFIVKDADNYYLGGHATSTWNMNSSVVEYWTIEPLEENGQYAFKSKSSGYMGFNNDGNTNAFRNKTKVAEAHYAFTIEEYVAPIQYTVTFENAPTGAAATIDGNVYTANTSFSVSKVLDENSVTNVADVEGYEHSYTYDAENKEFTITYSALPTYDYYVAIFPTDDTNLKIRIDGNEYGDSGSKTYTFYKVLTEADIVLPEYPGYYPNPSIEINNTYYIITVEYTPLPSLAIGSSATDREGNYWTSFCLDKPVSFPADVTPCIVTEAENGHLTVEEFPRVNNEVTTKYDFENNDVEEIFGNLYCSGDNHDVTMSCSGFSVYQSIGGKGYLTHEGTLNISCSTTPITKVIVQHWGWGTGANISLNGATPVAVADGGDAYTFDVNDYSCSLDITNYNGSVYILWIEVVTSSGETIPVIPANTGILVKADEAKANIAYTVHEDGEVNVDTSANILSASGETGFQVSDDADNLYYKLTLNAEFEAGSAGFYWGVDGGHSISVPAHKAYLRLPVAAASNRAAFLFGGDDTITAIEGINAEADNAPVYNLQGQRVNAAKAGVYVKNGRKVIVK